MALRQKGIKQKILAVEDKFLPAKISSLKEFGLRVFCWL